MLLLREESRSHTDAIKHFGLLSYPIYNPDFALLDYHLTFPLEKSLEGRYFSSDMALQVALPQRLQRSESNIYQPGIHDLCQRWKKAVEKDEHCSDK